MSETLLMLLLVLMLQVAAGQYRLVCPTPLIKAAAGDRAVIECHVDPPVNLKTKTVEFSKVDPYEVLLVHRSGEVDPDQSSSRISLSDEDLKRGIVRLQISPVQLSDSGLYKIRIPQLKAHCTFDLSVEKKDPEQNRINTQDDNTTTETKPKKPDENHVGAIVGGILGAIVLAGLILVLVKRRKKIWRKIGG
ncbi:butyrophilin subfamily 2 member A2-like isoform X3 [Mastacembelus armatus]|uniref:butyrophilin subfamily 2 member A2-like isoform X3 n=1 Tax=Mastacembelus armatus TaxID=205130 RepID=UPI000E462E2F|nr:butyrophilin subfamily 2 member A2-like isoform X3 [Mastacembelus armatus]